MVKLRKYSVLLLVLFSAMITHSIIPHAHHQHEEVKFVEHLHQHSHNTHQHAGEQNSKDHDESEGLLDFNFGDHSHTSYSDYNTTEVIRRSNKMVDSEKSVNTLGACVQQNNVFVTEKRQESPLHSCGIFKDQRSLIRSLRAPPSLV